MPRVTKINKITLINILKIILCVDNLTAKDDDDIVGDDIDVVVDDDDVVVDDNTVGNDHRGDQDEQDHPNQ